MARPGQSARTALLGVASQAESLAANGLWRAKSARGPRVYVDKGSNPADSGSGYGAAHMATLTMPADSALYLGEGLWAMRRLGRF